MLSVVHHIFIMFVKKNMHMHCHCSSRCAAYSIGILASDVSCLSVPLHVCIPLQLSSTAGLTSPCTGAQHMKAAELLMDNTCALWCDMSQSAACHVQLQNPFSCVFAWKTAVKQRKHGSSANIWHMPVHQTYFCLSLNNDLALLHQGWSQICLCRYIRHTQV